MFDYYFFQINILSIFWVFTELQQGIWKSFSLSPLSLSLGFFFIVFFSKPLQAKILLGEKYISRPAPVATLAYEDVSN